MSFGAAGVALVGAVPVTNGFRPFATITASTRNHANLTDCDASTTDSAGGDAGGAGGYAGSEAPLSHSVMSESVVAGTSIACHNHTHSGGIGTRAGSAMAATRPEAVEGCLTVAQNSEHDAEVRSKSQTAHGEFLVGPTGTSSTKVQPQLVTVATPQARPASSTSLAPSPLLSKMENSSRGLDQLPQQRQQPVSPRSPSSHALLSTAVSVRHLYRVPLAFYGHNNVASSAVLSAARNHRRHGDARTGSTPPCMPTEDTTQTQTWMLPESNHASKGMDALEKRARRAAELHASCSLGDESETELAWATASRSGEAGRTQNPMLSSLGTVQVARGYLIPGHLCRRGADERLPLDGDTVNLVPGSKRRRWHERMGSAAGGRLDQQLSHASNPGGGGGGGGGAPVSMRYITSPSASSLSSVALASPPFPAMAHASSTASATCSGATRPPTASSPFNALLAAFGSAPSGKAALTSSATGLPVRTSTVPPSRPPLWLQPWLSHALSRAMAAYLERDADRLTAAATPAATATPGLDSFFPVAHVASATATGASASAQLCTLRSALLLIFDGLERLETDLKKVLLNGPSACHPLNFVYGTGVCDGRTSFSSVPSLPAAAAASEAFDGLAEQLRRLTRQWCDVLSQWPCEAATLGYMEWWVNHPAWAELVVYDATVSATFSVSPAMPAVMDRKEETAGRRAEGTGDDGQPPKPPPQSSVVALQGVLSAVVTEGMRTLLDALVDAFVRAVRELLRHTGVAIQPQRESGSTSRPNVQAEVAALAKAQHTCLALLRLLTSLYVNPTPALQQLLALVQGDAFCDTTVTGMAASSDGNRTTRREDEGSPASPSSFSTATAVVVAGEDRKHQPQPLPLHSSTPHGVPPGASSAPRAVLSAQSTSQLRSRVCQLHYQLLYAICRLCNELPMLWSPHDVTQDTEEDAESDGVRVSSAAYMDRSLCFRYHGECELEKLTLFATAVRLAATVSALLLHVQLPMKGDLLCVASRLAQWRSTLLWSSCMSEREYTAAMGHLCALMAQAT
ncbi:hypothetical protein, conserved [Leishmania tarentolae]|uniref:Uncharacterized protein n=1 Tax=Leishmania tarentolae TaxID=5689 RepID=A0A640KC51_LEITA|nr:hypothetical protein, conserved [Leishmania tarentolae]